MNPNSFKPEGPLNPEPEPSARHGTLAEARSEAAASLEPGGRVQGSSGCGYIGIWNFRAYKVHRIGFQLSR